jgi:putative restriction endonuclease
METEAEKRGTDWTREETVLAMDLYSRIPFGQCNKSNKSVQLLAQKIGRSPSSIARKLGNIGRLDPALKSRGVVGLTHGSKMDELVWNDAHANWSAFLAEAIDAEQRYGFNPPVIPEPIVDIKLTERLTTVKARIGQRFFRAAVLGSYRSQCSMCSLDDERLVIASHIRAWAVDEANRLNPRNGIALCVLHDAAFDGNLVTLNEQLRWKFLPSLKKHFAREPFNRFFAAYEGMEMNLPDRWLPDPEFLYSHRELCKRN